MDKYIGDPRPRMLKKLKEDEFAPEDETFEEYLKRTRREFCHVIRSYTVDDHSELRVAVDDLLIAFDQATEKAIKS